MASQEAHVLVKAQYRNSGLFLRLSRTFLSHVGTVSIAEKGLSIIPRWKCDCTEMCYRFC